MSPGSSLSGLLEFGANTSPDRVPARSSEAVLTGKNASFRKSLDQAVQDQRQQTAAQAPDGSKDGQTAARADTKAGTSVSGAQAPAKASGKSADEEGLAGEVLHEDDLNGEGLTGHSAQVVQSGPVDSGPIGAAALADSAITSVIVPLAPDSGIAVDAGLSVSNTTTDVINLNPAAGVMTGTNAAVASNGDLPLVPVPVLPGAELAVGERRTPLAALTVAERSPVFAATESGLSVPRSLHELRFSEFLQSQPGGVTLGNPSMDPLSPALATNIESMLLVDENALKLEAGVDWVVDESNLSLSSLSKATSSLQMPGLASGEAQRISVPVNVVFGDERWQQLAAERTVTLLQQGVKSAELMLDPPELGPLQVRIQMQNDQAVIHFTSASAAVRDALDQTFPRLREMLQDQGVELLQADVSDHSSQHSAEEEVDERGPLLSREPGPPESVLDAEIQGPSLVLNSGIDDFA